MQKAYSRIKWENEPSQETPLNDANLNRMDSAIDEVDNRIITLEITKANKTEISEFFTEITFDESTGVLTFTRKNGSTIKIDTKLEKLAVNFAYDADNERLVITLDDGSVQYVDMKALITQYEFTESDTILLSVDSSGKVSASIKLGSITGDMLEPNYLANVTVQAESAAASAGAAALSETNAAKSAENAAASESKVASDASIASESAEAAAKSEENAATSESNANTSAESAARNAESAAASAESAGASATTATNAAASASASASAAAESAATAIDKASEAEASAEAAEAAAQKAESVSAVEIATTGKAGIVKPDGTTITVDPDGTIHGNASVTVDTELSTESTNPIANKAVAENFANYVPNNDGAEIFVPLGKTLTIKTEYGASGSGMSMSTSFTGASHSFGGAIGVNPSNISFSKQVRTTQEMYVNNNIVLHAGNIASYGAELETGTFTLTGVGMTFGSSFSYVKVGKFVYVYGSGSCTSAQSGLTTIAISGFPFAISNTYYSMFYVDFKGADSIIQNSWTSIRVSSSQVILTSSGINLVQNQPMRISGFYVTNE